MSAGMSKYTPGPWVIDWNVARLDIFSSDAKVLDFKILTSKFPLKFMKFKF